MRLNSVFNVLDLGVAALAVAARFPATEEIEVLAPVADRTLDQQAALMAFVVTLTAPDAALQIVRVLSQALPRRCTSLEHLLNTLEQRFGNKRLVSPLVQLSVVSHDAAVVGVPKHGLELRRGDRPGWVPTWSSDQSTIREFLLQTTDRELAGCVEVEGEPHEWGPLLVQGHGAHLAAIELLDDVGVAERCTPERPALAGLLAHLVADIRPVLG